MRCINSCCFVVLILICFIQTVMAHDGEPNMAFAWRDGKILVDTQGQGRTLNGHTAFVIPFDSTLMPNQMSDSGISGFGFDQGTILQYQIVSTLMKWSTAESRWLRDGFDERLSIRLAFATRNVSATAGEGTQGIVALLGNAGLTEAVHPTFELKKAGGSDPDDGAYLIAMTLFGVNEGEGRIIHPPSKPFFLAFHLNTDNNFDRPAFNQALNELPDIPLSDFSRLDSLYDWAEADFRELFPHPAQSRFIFGFYARCYDNAICVGSKRGRVFTTGAVPFGGLTDHGPLEPFFEAAGL